MDTATSSQVDAPSNREEVEDEFEDGDEHQEHPCLWFNSPEHLHQPDVYPDE